VAREQATPQPGIRQTPVGPFAWHASLTVTADAYADFSYGFAAFNEVSDLLAET